LSAQTKAGEDGAQAKIERLGNSESLVVHDIRSQPGVDTVEGKYVKLIFGSKIRAQTLELPAGIVMDLHRHPRETLVYTLSGRWVHKHDAESVEMEEGDMVHFPADAAIAADVPYDEPALLLVINSDLPS
jgi:quercetin dioxygenase-like cupin family protein